MSLSQKEIQDPQDELKASRASRRRAWEVLQEIRWVLQDTAGVSLPPPARKTIDLEGRTVKDGVQKASIFSFFDLIFKSSSITSSRNPGLLFSVYLFSFLSVSNQ